MLNEKSVLITGGTGSFGKKFVETILRDYPQVKRIVIYSRDELKQFELSKNTLRQSILNYVSLLETSGMENVWNVLAKA